MRLSISALVLAFALSSPAVAAPAPQNSWGKAGVTLDQCRQDSIYCASAAYYRDITKNKDVEAFVSASQQLDAVNNRVSTPAVTSVSPISFAANDELVQIANQQEQIIQSIHPQQRFDNVAKLLRGTVDQCLVGRGYSKFWLTDDQRHRLTKLKAGSDERRAYLYSLASDPAVLQNQKEPEAQP